MLYTMGEFAALGGQPDCAVLCLRRAVFSRATDRYNYVRAVVARYKGKIGARKIWNEPTFYSGTVLRQLW